MNREQELNQISNRIKQAIWNEEKQNSEGYIIDLNNAGNMIRISGTIEEISKEDFRPEAHYFSDKEEIQFGKALEQYKKMQEPYVFNLKEYNNLMRLPEHTRDMFYQALLEVENKLEGIGEGKTSDIRFRLFKKENEKKKLYVEKELIEKQYIEISEKKEQNNKEINEYLTKIKKNSKFVPVNIINKIFNKKDSNELNELYKNKARVLEKENIDKTAEAFEKLLQKNDVNKRIKEVENEVESLRSEYKAETNIDEKKTELLKEKNMLFKVFYIDNENDYTKENQIEENEFEEESE